MEKIMFAVVAEIFEVYGLNDSKFMSSKIVSIHPTREAAENAGIKIYIKNSERESEAWNLLSTVKNMMKEWKIKNPYPRENEGDSSILNAWYDSRDDEEERLKREVNFRRIPPRLNVTIMEIPMLTPEEAVESWDSWAATQR